MTGFLISLASPRTWLCIGCKWFMWTRHIQKQSQLFHYGSECVITPRGPSSKSKKHEGLWREQGFYTWLTGYKVLSPTHDAFQLDYTHSTSTTLLRSCSVRQGLNIIAGDSLFNKWCKYRPAIPLIRDLFWFLVGFSRFPVCAQSPRSSVELWRNKISCASAARRQGLYWSRRYAIWVMLMINEESRSTFSLIDTLFTSAYQNVFRQYNTKLLSV